MSGELAGRGLTAEGAEVLVLLAVHGDPPAVTANLAGPLVIEDGLGRQLVLEDPTFPLRALLTPAE
jgi:flagellar assembly factor FliW